MYMVDYIGRVETLQASFDKLCEHLGVPTSKLGRENKGIYRGKWQNYYDKESFRVVSSFYAEDIRRFGYEAPEGYRL